MAMNTILVGLGAGVVSAVLTLPMVEGAPLGLLLFLLAPLPIAIATLGWHHTSGIVASLACAILIAALYDIRYALSVTAGIALPMWWLGYLALLAKPVGETAQGEPVLEWYPVGRLVVWAAALGAALIFAQILILAGSAEEFQARLRVAVEALMRRDFGTAPEKAAPAVNLMVALLPPTSAVMFTLLTLGNLWIAARVVRASGRLKRPWPALRELNYSGLVLPVFLAAIGASLMEGLAGIAGVLAAATLFIAYVLAGLAVIHFATSQMSARLLLLTVLYVALLVQGWLLLFVSLLGIADQIFGLRARIMRRSGPGGGAGSNASLS